MRSVFAAIVFLGLTLSACGGDSTPKATPTPAATATPADVSVAGTFLLKMKITGLATPIGFHSTPTPIAGSCQGAGGYNDIAPGMEVDLLDGTTVLDVGHFGSGSVANVDTSNPYQVTWDCRFTFTLDIPPGHTFYTVKVGRRGDRSYSWDDIQAPGALAYTIGP